MTFDVMWCNGDGDADDDIDGDVDGDIDGYCFEEKRNQYWR